MPRPTTHDYKAAGFAQVPRGATFYMVSRALLEHTDQLLAGLQGITPRDEKTLKVAQDLAMQLRARFYELQTKQDAAALTRQHTILSEFRDASPEERDRIMAELEAGV